MPQFVSDEHPYYQNFQRKQIVIWSALLIIVLGVSGSLFYFSYYLFGGGENRAGVINQPMIKTPIAKCNPRTQRAEQSPYDGNPRTERAEPRLGKSLAGLRFVRQSQSSWTKREQSSYDGDRHRNRLHNCCRQKADRQKYISICRKPHQAGRICRASCCQNAQRCHFKTLGI